MTYNTSVMFDIKFYDDNQCNEKHPFKEMPIKTVIEAVSKSQFPSDKVLQLIAFHSL